MSKSYVTLALCPICQKESGELLMDRRLKPTFEMHTIVPTSVCKDCKEKYLKRGVMLINPDTGALVVLRTVFYKRLFNKPVPRGHIVYCSQDVLDKINNMNASNN